LRDKGIRGKGEAEDAIKFVFEELRFDACRSRCRVILASIKAGGGELEVQYQEPGRRWCILQHAAHPSIRGRSRYRRGTGLKSWIGPRHLKSTGHTDALLYRRKPLMSRMSTRSTKGGQNEEVSEGTETHEVGRARIYLKGKVLATVAHLDRDGVNARVRVRQYNDARERRQRRIIL